MILDSLLINFIIYYNSKTNKFKTRKIIFVKSKKLLGPGFLPIRHTLNIIQPTALLFPPNLFMNISAYAF